MYFIYQFFADCFEWIHPVTGNFFLHTKLNAFSKEHAVQPVASNNIFHVSALSYDASTNAQD